jgi:hypothetical protein
VGSTGQTHQLLGREGDPHEAALRRLQVDFPAGRRSVSDTCYGFFEALCLTGPVDYPFASRHKGPGFKSPGGYLCETKILLLELSRYIGDPDVIDHCGLV